MQPGDFIGLKLPNTDRESEIYFTGGGPINYVFQGELNSTIELNDSDFIQQRPQIAFNLTSGINFDSFLYTTNIQLPFQIGAQVGFCVKYQQLERDKETTIQ